MKSRLNFAFVKSVKHSGRNGPDKYHDEHGLFLRVRASGKLWFWRGTVQGRRRELGLGAFPYVSLAEARERALDYCRIARAGRVCQRALSGLGSSIVAPRRLVCLLWL